MPARVGTVILNTLESAGPGTTPFIREDEMKTFVVQSLPRLKAQAAAIWPKITAQRSLTDEVLALMVPAASLLWGGNTGLLLPVLHELLAHPSAGPLTADTVLVWIASSPRWEGPRPGVADLWRKAFGLGPGPRGVVAAASAMGELLPTDEGMALLATLMYSSLFHLKALEPLTGPVTRLPSEDAEQAIAIITERLRGPFAPPTVDPLDRFVVNRFIENIEGLMTNASHALWMNSLMTIAEGGLADMPLLERLRNTLITLHSNRRVIDDWTAYRHARQLERRALSLDVTTDPSNQLTPSASRFTEYAVDLAALLRR